MFFRRGVARDGRWLQLKLWLFSIGALLALVGMAVENDWVMGAAGLVLLVGFLLRFAEKDRDEVDGTTPPGSRSGEGEQPPD